jgi:methionine-rich copper-binding protein CopC
MRRRSFASLIAAGMLALVPLGAASAAAAPAYTSSDPADGAELHEAPASVSVTFSEPLDPGSELKVFACGKRVDAGETTVTINELEVELASGPTGKYEARWVATGLAGVTGTSEGAISFSVGHGQVSCSGSGHEGHGSGNKGEHGGHKDPGGNHEGGEHSDSGHSNTTHSGSGHSGTSAHSGTGSHSSSSAHSSSGHKDSGHGGNHEMDHDKAGNEDGPADANDGGNHEFASDNGPLPIPTPEAGAVLLALVACVGLGVAAGWLARLV